MFFFSLNLFFVESEIYDAHILPFWFQEFRLLHFAGEVTYSIQGFLDKNNDSLFRDLKEVKRSVLQGLEWFRNRILYWEWSWLHPDGCYWIALPDLTCFQSLFSITGDESDV